MACHLDLFVDGNDELTLDAAQGVGLVVQSNIVTLRQGNLQHKLLIVLRDQERLGGSTLTEFLLDDVATLKAVAPFRLQRISDERLFGCGEFVLDIVEQREEIFD